MNKTELMEAILEHACPNGGVAEDGWNTYVIETHCVEWHITARKNAGKWVVRRVTSEAC